MDESCIMCSRSFSNRKYILLLMVVLIIFSMETLSEKTNSPSTYRGAVLQLQKTSDVSVYPPYIKQAKSEEAEIILFPEIGVLQETPDTYEPVVVGSFPCSESNIPIQKTVSCSALENKIYVVIDFGEKGEKCEVGTKYCHPWGFYVYNTAIVFDRKGMVLEKYRKHNIYTTEKKLFKPGPPNLVHFSTDFGITFGLFVCFDILWGTPSEYVLTKYKINNVLFPTHWVDFSSVPAPLSNLKAPFQPKKGILFLYGSEVQQGYSEFFQTNLLAANNVERSTGSGLFSRGKALNTTDEIATKLLTADLPIFEYIPHPSIGKTKELEWTEDSNFEIFRATPGKQSFIRANLDSHICDFMIDVDENIKNVEYFLIGAIRFENVGVKSASCVVKNCGSKKTFNVTACVHDTPDTNFRFLMVNMTVIGEIRAIYPLITGTGRAPVKEFEKILFSHEGNSHIFIMNGVSDPVSYAVQFGIMNVTENI